MTTQVDGKLENLSFIKRRVTELAEKIAAPTGSVTFGESRQDGSPHIEVGKLYAFVVCERGNEFERRLTADLDELLYWIMSTKTFSMASDYELKHRREGEHSRRQLFSKHEDLLARLSSSWSARKASEHAAILQQHPFNDTLG